MTVNFVNPHDVMFFDTDGAETVQANSMFPIFDAPDTPLYHQKWANGLAGLLLRRPGGTAACRPQLRGPV